MIGIWRLIKLLCQSPGPCQDRVPSVQPCHARTQPGDRAKPWVPHEPLRRRDGGIRRSRCRWLFVRRLVDVSACSQGGVDGRPDPIRPWPLRPLHERHPGWIWIFAGNRPQPPITSERRGNSWIAKCCKYFSPGERDFPRPLVFPSRLVSLAAVFGFLTFRLAG